MDVFERVQRAVLGDPLEADLLPKPIAYEEVHNDVQSILIPPLFPKGINVHFLQSVNKHFALQHRIGLEPGPLQQTMFGPMPGPGERYYSLGAVITHVSQQGGKYRLTGQYDVENGAGKLIALGDVFGDGRLRVTVQGEDKRSEGAPEWGVTARYATRAGVLVARVKDGAEVGASYNARLTPYSPVTVGGEVYLKLPAVAGAVSAAAAHLGGGRAGGGAPSSGSNAAAGGGGGGDDGKTRMPSLRGLGDFALGAAYDTGLHKTGLHFASTSSFPAVASVHHLYRVTERSTLAAKYMLNLSSASTMAAVGYRLKFRNTLTSVHGMLDSYGTARIMVEREPVKDIRMGLSLEGKLSPGAQATKPGPDGYVVLGFQVSAGALNRLPQQQSPCTMTRSIFGLT